MLIVVLEKVGLLIEAEAIVEVVVVTVVEVTIEVVVVKLLLVEM